MAYGLEVFNAAGTRIIRATDRLVRFVGHGVVSVKLESYVNVAVSGMANDDSWGVILGTPPVLWLSTAGITFEKGVNNLEIKYAAPVFPYGITSPKSAVISYYVFRT